MISRRHVTMTMLLALLVASVVARASAAAAPPFPPLQDVLPIAQMASVYGDSFDLPAPPAGQTPEERAHWILHERPALGRTPMEWIRWSTSNFAFRPAAAFTTPVPRDLTAEVARLYASVGAPPGDPAAIAEAAARMPGDLRAPFAELVGVVADVYALQLPIAGRIATRLNAGFDPHTPLLTAPERDLMAARQAAILRALDRFRARTRSAFDALAARAPRPVSPEDQDPPIFSDPEGLVILGGVGDGTYTRAGFFPDPVLLVEPSGSDLYLNSAGGACPVTTPDFGTGVWLQCNQLVVSVVADLGDGIATPANDVYSYDGVPSAVQGAGGPGAIGMLVDVAGDDQYLAKMTRGTIEPFGPIYYFDGGGQGYGYAGNGLLLDGVGDDIYRFDVNSTAGRSIWALAQGFGGAGGLGVASDGLGADQWLSNGLGLVGGGFEGLYTDGVGFYGGVGIMTDTGQGDDVYRAIDVAQTVDLYAQGFGAFGGLGILYEDGGNDDYYALEQGTNPWIDPLLNCTYGTASFGGVGIMVDVAGDDVTYGASISKYGAYVMDSGFGGPGVAYGLFVDTSGDDRYEMVAQGTKRYIEGRGYYEPGYGGDPFGEPFGANTFGTFVDIGGTDTYIGGYGANDTQWAFGVDRGA